jgi:L-alanine-DL-glutamate epimerase-like enolase superfamily enzyme
MRIIDIRETAVPLNSSLANSSFDFSEMTTSVVALITDVVRDGSRVVGYAFNSTGRYACGAAMRARFIPRILAAKPESLLDGSGENFAPEKALACMMQREKSGGHSERSIAIGTIEVALWDAVAKIADLPLCDLLADRFNGKRRPEKVFCYVGGGWYRPGQTIADLQDEMRRHLDAGYTMLKMKVGGLPLADDLRRVEAVKSVLPAGAMLAVDANSKFDREGHSPTQRRSSHSVCAGSRSLAIRLISRRCRRSPASTASRSRPARICTPPRTSKTSCASAACGRSAMT